MTQEQKDMIKNSVANFRLPRYHEIPDVGLYLEQMVKYINEFLTPLGDVAITPSMVSNYVKMKLIASPVHKQYTREQIAHLFIITIAKTVVSLENVRIILAGGNEAGRRYDYFADTFTKSLLYIYDVKNLLDDVDQGENDDHTELVYNVILTIANKLYIDQCFVAVRREREEKAQAREANPTTEA